MGEGARVSAVTLTTPSGAQLSAELQTRRTFRLPATGSAGDAELMLPYTSPLAALVSPDGGDELLIAHGTAGDWRGVTTTVEYGEAGIRLSAVQPWALLGRRVVKRSDTVRNVWPGYLVGAALDAAQVAGLSRRYGPLAGDTPAVPEYQWSYPDAWSVVQAMADISDGELHVDAASGRMDWCGAFAYAAAYGPLLIAGQSVLEWRYTSSTEGRLAEVVGVVDGEPPYSATLADAAVAHWPAQAVVSGGGRAEARSLADQTLARAAYPGIVIEGAVTYAHAALRERDYVQVFVPRVGRTHTLRTLARTLDDASPLIRCEWQVMPDAATVRVKAPGASLPTRGRAIGSFVQVMLRMARERLGAG